MKNIQQYITKNQKEYNVFVSLFGRVSSPGKPDEEELSDPGYVRLLGNLVVRGLIVPQGNGAYSMTDEGRALWNWEG